MDIGKLVFLLLLAMCVVFGIAFFVDEVPFSHGDPHPDHATMNQGGDGGRHDTILWLGTTLGVIEVILSVVLLAFGILPGRPQRIALSIAGIVFLATFLAMIVSYHGVISGPSPGTPKIFLGLPVPTAWMVYGLGGIPLLFVFMYVVMFDSWVLTPEDHRAFRDAVEAQRPKAEGIAEQSPEPAPHDDLGSSGKSE